MAEAFTYYADEFYGERNTRRAIVAGCGGRAHRGQVVVGLKRVASRGRVRGGRAPMCPGGAVGQLTSVCGVDCDLGAAGRATANQRRGIDAQERALGTAADGSQMLRVVVRKLQGSLRGMPAGRRRHAQADGSGQS